MNRLGTITTLRIETEILPEQQAKQGGTPPAELVFQVCTHWRYTALALGTVFSFAAGVCVWSRAERDVILELLALAVLFLTGSAWSRRTELRVSSEGLTAVGNLGGFRRGYLRLGWNRVRELHFGPGGGGEIGGLYAREGSWCSRCILPRVTEAQADKVTAAIAERYPELPLAGTRSTHMVVSWPAPQSAGVATGVPVGRMDAR